MGSAADTGFPQLPQGYCKNGSGKHSLSGAIFNYIYWGADMLLHCFSNAVWTGWLSDSLHSNTRISPASKMVSPWGTSSWSCRLTETTSAPLGQGISWMVLPHTGAPKQTGDLDQKLFATGWRSGALLFHEPFQEHVIDRLRVQQICNGVGGQGDQ